MQMCERRVSKMEGLASAEATVGVSLLCWGPAWRGGQQRCRITTHVRAGMVTHSLRDPRLHPENRGFCSEWNSESCRHLGSERDLNAVSVTGVQCWAVLSTGSALLSDPGSNPQRLSLHWLWITVARAKVSAVELIIRDWILDIFWR